MAAITRKTLGKGQIVLLGTLPTPEGIARLLGMSAPQCGVDPVAEASENLLVVPRSGPAGSGLIAVEMENKPGRMVLPRRMRDLLTGLEHEGWLDVEPYGVVVLT